MTIDVPSLTSKPLSASAARADDCALSLSLRIRSASKRPCAATAFASASACRPIALLFW